MKKILSIFILLLIVMELVLRLTGYALLFPSDLRNSISKDDKEVLSILVLGESTTADFFCDKTGDFCSWPRQLEQQLISRGVKARVYNGAISGTDSIFILLKLPELIERYNPQIVISMMGINDSNLSYSRDSRTFDFLNNLRVVRVAKWTLSAMKSLNSCKMEYVELDQKYKADVNNGIALAKAAQVEKVESFLKKTIYDQKQLSVAIMMVGLGVLGPSGPGAKRLQALPFFARAFELNPFNSGAAFFAIQEGSSLNEDSRCLDYSKKYSTVQMR